MFGVGVRISGGGPVRGWFLVLGGAGSGMWWICSRGVRYVGLEVGAAWFLREG